MRHSHTRPTSSNWEKSGSGIVVLPPHTDGEMGLSYPIFRLPNYPQATGTLPYITQSIASPSSTRVRPPQETPAAPHDSVPPLSESIPALPLETPPAPLTPRVTPIPLSSITPRVTAPPPAIPPPSALLTSPPSAPLSPRVTAPPPATPMGMGLKSCDKLKAEIQAKLDAKSLTGSTLTIMAHGDVKGQQVVGSCEGNTKKIVFNRSQN